MLKVFVMRKIMHSSLSILKLSWNKELGRREHIYCAQGNVPKKDFLIPDLVGQQRHSNGPHIGRVVTVAMFHALDNIQNNDLVIPVLVGQQRHSNEQKWMTLHWIGDGFKVTNHLHSRKNMATIQCDSEFHRACGSKPRGTSSVVRFYFGCEASFVLRYPHCTRNFSFNRTAHYIAYACNYDGTAIVY